MRVAIAHVHKLNFDLSTHELQRDSTPYTSGNGRMTYISSLNITHLVNIVKKFDRENDPSELADICRNELVYRNYLKKKEE